MTLTAPDSALFLKLMRSLQHFVNQKLGIVSGVTTVEKYSSLPIRKKLAVRNALYEHPELIDEYVRENPQGYSDDELEIVKGWKQFRQGAFFIERLLKKYAIFIQGNKVYGVVALQDPFEEILPYVPYYVKTVLLPFKKKIVYDGILEGHNVYFGRGAKQALKEIYMAAKQQGRIIVSFDASEQKKKSAAKRKDWKPLLDELAQGAKKLRASSGEPAIHSPTFSLIKASIEFARIATDHPDDTDRLWKAYKRVERAMRKAETVLRRLEYFERGET